MRHVFDSIAIAPSVRTAIVAPVACRGVVIEQTDQDNDALLWTAAAGGDARTLYRGSEFRDEPGPSRVLPGHMPNPSGYRAGQTILYVEAVGGVGPIALDFLL